MRLTSQATIAYHREQATAVTWIQIDQWKNRDIIHFHIVIVPDRGLQSRTNSSNPVSDCRIQVDRHKTLT